jgi:hypothetical protein
MKGDNIFKILWLVTFSIVFCSLTQLQAGTVRTVYSDNMTIQPIFLRMGQSTILRFVERPKKVVLGNSNYYSVEFIDNDLAIQPLGEVTTNLFVYGMKNVYGFILKTNQSATYDDLVQVDLIENKVNVLGKMALIPSPFKEMSRPRLAFQVGNELKVMLSRIQRFEGKDFYIIDFQFENISKNKINLSKVDLVLNRGKLKISPQEFILRETILGSRESTSARMFISIIKKADLDIQVRFKNITIKQMILGRFL